MRMARKQEPVIRWREETEHDPSALARGTEAWADFLSASLRRRPPATSRAKKLEA